jgi:SAM-dependent methyltransferase
MTDRPAPVPGPLNVVAPSALPLLVARGAPGRHRMTESAPHIVGIVPSRRRGGTRSAVSVHTAFEVRSLMTPATKPADYYASDRTDFLDWVGGFHTRVLDIGCGAGANAGWYRRHGATWIEGIEIDGPSAAAAAERFDRVVHGSVDDALGHVRGRFDLIVCADVLEHLVDPWAVVDRLRLVSHDMTILAVSIPNIRFLPALARIAVGRGFEYEERGIFDATHLRFFVRCDVDRMLRQGGWLPSRWGAPPFGRFGSVRRMARRISAGRSDEWLAAQLFVVATLRR